MKRVRPPVTNVALIALVALHFIGTSLLLGAEDAPGHPECRYIGSDAERFMRSGLKESFFKSQPSSVGLMTEAVTAQLPEPQPLFSKMASKFDFAPTLGHLVDRRIFLVMSDAGVTPALLTNDYEFIRRASLDLTGRTPTMERVLEFVADTSADKRAQLIDELLDQPEWVDKWTMYFGDLWRNDSFNTQVRRYREGALAFNNWIRDSLSANKPYDQMAQELIAAQGTNSYQVGEINWLVGGIMGGGPIQDVFDKETARLAEQFLGIAHLDCILCHDGAGHLDALSLWGTGASRFQGWQLSSFLSRTDAIRIPVTAGVPQPYYWALFENTPRTGNDYPLNTLTGNRPPRQPLGDIANVSPVYPFSGQGPLPGENYRVALGREVTSDFQFARAAVNYIWKEFFGIGIVDPLDQFDLARLDPDNPPAEPWTLQPSHPRLLNNLAQYFIDSGYDLKALMRIIATSEAYQLSSRFEGDWDPAWERLFARKLVRRLWAEEIHDAIAQTSNILPAYSMPVYGTTGWAMQFPETANTPAGGRNPISLFLDNFLRGNRDDLLRNSEGSISQALELMNNNYVMLRVLAALPEGVVAQNLNLPDDQLVNTLFLTVLSRYPTSEEMAAALNHLGSGNRTQEAENLLWVLYNKVDFIFNY